MIRTSRSAIASLQSCNRRRYWEYEAPSGPDGQKGWERRRLALPLATGSYVHKVVEGLLKGTEPAEAILAAKTAYLAEAISREVEGEQETLQSRLVQEQAALIEAIGWGWHRTRLHRLLEEYEVVDVEREEQTELAHDVVLLSRSDAVLRRRSDGRLFVYNPKTAANPSDRRWIANWEVDMQLMTEVLAVERRLGERVYGVLIEGFDKGARVSEKDSVGTITGWRQSSPLIYGYKQDADPPLVPITLYDHEYTRRKGWKRFPVWEEEFGKSSIPGVANQFAGQFPRWEKGSGLMRSPIEWWVNWIPLETVEAQFVPLPPIMRDERSVESCVRQVVAMERRIEMSMMDISLRVPSQLEQALDEHFPQSFHACLFPSRCQMFEICHTPGVASDVAGSGLYQPRVSNHPEASEAE